MEKDKAALVKEFKEKIDNGKTPEEIKLEWIKEIEKKKMEEVKKAKKEAFILGIEQRLGESETLKDKLKGGKLEELKGGSLKEALNKLGTWIGGKEEWKEGFKGQVDMLKNLKSKLEELAAIRGLKGGVERLKGELDKLSEPGDLEQLEAKKLEEVEAAKKEVADKIEKVKEKVGDTGLGKKVEELGEKFKRLTEQDSAELVQRVREELRESEALEKVKNLGLEGIRVVVKLKSKLEELAAIRELRALGLEERLRELAEVKEVRALAEKRKELDVQGGLQLTERIRALGGQLDRLEARRLAESTEGNLEEVWILGNLGQLDELATGKKLRESEATRATLKQLKEIKLVDLERKLETMGELKKEIEKIKNAQELEKLEQEKIKEVEAALKKVKSGERVGSSLKEELKGQLEAGKLKEAKITKLKELVKELEKPGTVSQGELKEGKENLKSKLEELAAIRELKELGFKDWLRLRTLEELTEIAEKRGVATVMKAALASAMEIAKNRGWTDSVELQQ